MSAVTLFGIGSDARFSPCRKYRYTLFREWDSALPRVMFLMLNPSTADETQDDPTIRRCIAFAKSWGYGSLVVCNIFAFRATDPKAMKSERFPIGPENDEAIRCEAVRCNLIIAAWGSHGTHQGRDRQVAQLMKIHRLNCLGTTKGGQPKHPLYVAGSTEPVMWCPSLFGSATQGGMG